MKVNSICFLWPAIILLVSSYIHAEPAYCSGGLVLASMFFAFSNDSRKAGD